MVFEIQKNNVTVKGNGKTTIMFAHGFGCDQNMWRFIVPDFIEDYQVILFDYTGFGHSSLDEYEPSKYSELTGYADDILEVKKFFNN